ncbi:PadR family transcriptional regulator [Stenotrophomonas sp. BIGb0135]|jgi:PadR family transcriptional regulator PadR|uniref:PadR family transcriptional regulator n=1 Tax=Stenotrophomonas nematodicola TaxID=2656746 RepID=A0ABW7CTF0_9GAMM|nr:PadR family transcriptional regulator [Stenotrophomonas sp. BIGb0135]MCS4234082.1 PadR family transcriptional regulator PadR [Stenotrophomonas sp. BIGb0135]
MSDDDVYLKKFQKELSAGTVSLAMLAVLARAGEPLYGYLIAKELERVGEGVLSGKQSALYPVLRNLEGAGLLESHVEPSMAGPPRRYYRINERGRQVLEQWSQAWRATRDSVDSVLEGVLQ